MASTQKTGYTKEEVDKLVNELSTKFDISRFQEVGYDEIQKLAEKYLASDDPELHAVGQELKFIDPKIFELSPAEQELKELHKTLTENGKSKKDADLFGLQVLQVASQKVIEKIVSAMNEESYNAWINLQGHSPNILQQTYLLDQTAQMLLNKSFDDLYEEAIKSTVKMSKNLMEAEKKATKLAANLTEEQAKVVRTAFDSNEYETAIQLIYNYAQGESNN